MILESNQSFGNYQEQAERLQCRICLQQISIISSRYCECKGNHRNIHDKCLKEWVKRTPKFKDQQQKMYIFCDLCKSRIYLQLTRVCHCKTLQELFKECKEEACKIFLALVIFAVFSLTLFICATALSKSPEKSIALISLIVFSSIVVIFSFPLLIFRLLLTCKYQIDGFLHFSQVIRNFSVANSSIVA